MCLWVCGASGQPPASYSPLVSPRGLVALPLQCQPVFWEEICNTQWLTPGVSVSLNYYSTSPVFATTLLFFCMWMFPSPTPTPLFTVRRCCIMQNSFLSHRERGDELWLHRWFCEDGWGRSRSFNVTDHWLSDIQSGSSALFVTELQQEHSRMTMWHTGSWATCQCVYTHVLYVCVVVASCWCSKSVCVCLRERWRRAAVAQIQRGTHAAVAHCV